MAPRPAGATGRLETPPAQFTSWAGVCSKFELQPELQVAIIRVGRSDLPHGARSDVGVREAEVRAVGQIEGIQAELDVEALADAVVLDKGNVEAHLARRIQHASRRISVGVGLGRREVVRVEPEL